MQPLPGLFGLRPERKAEPGVVVAVVAIGIDVAIKREWTGCRRAVPHLYRAWIIIVI